MSSRPDRTMAPAGQTDAPARRVPIALAGIAAVLCLAVAVIHLIDQNGLPGSKDPSYVGIGYYLLEISAVIIAVLLLAPRTRHAVLIWSVAFFVGLGPIAGFVLSRGPGLPGYADDKGNWTEPLGVISLVVEAVLLVVSLTGVTRARAQESGTTY